MALVLAVEHFKRISVESSLHDSLDVLNICSISDFVNIFIYFGQKKSFMLLLLLLRTDPGVVLQEFQDLLQHDSTPTKQTLRSQ